MAEVISKSNHSVAESTSKENNVHLDDKKCLQYALRSFLNIKVWVMEPIFGTALTALFANPLLEAIEKVSSVVDIIKKILSFCCGRS